MILINEVLYLSTLKVLIFLFFQLIKVISGLFFLKSAFFIIKKEFKFIYLGYLFVE